MSQGRMLIKFKDGNYQILPSKSCLDENGDAFKTVYEVPNFFTHNKNQNTIEIVEARFTHFSKHCKKAICYKEIQNA